MALSIDHAIRKVTGKVYYGWWIVLSATLSVTMFSGLYFYGAGTFFLPLLNEFGSSRTALSGAFSLARLESGMAGLISGYAVDRWGPRLVILLGVVLMGAGMMVMTQVHSLLWFYVAFVSLVSLGGSLAFTNAPLIAVVNWFLRKRGLALGITMSGVGIGGGLVPLLGWLVDSYGWRTAAVVSGAIVWGVGIPLALLFRHRPERYGLHPDGTSEAPSQQVQAKTGEEVDFTVLQALRTKAFWLLSGYFAIRQMTVGAVTVHLIPYYQELGASPKLAASILGLVAVTSIPGRLGFGWLGDRVAKRHLLALVAGLSGLSMVLLGAIPHLWAVPLFLVLYAPADGGCATLMMSVRAEYYGRRAYGTIIGLMSVVILAGGVAGPVLAGFLRDVYDSYQIPFLAAGATTVVTTVLMPFATPPRLQPAQIGNGTETARS